MNGDLRVSPDAESLATTVATAFVERLAAVQADGRTPHVVLTGGTIADAIHREVARLAADSDVDFTDVAFWFGDERFVAPDSDERNAGQARAAFLDAVGATQVHEVASTADVATVDEAAAAYDTELQEHLVGAVDLVMLGVGPDGHVASLFPGYPQLEVTEAALAVAVEDSPKPPPRRVTLTFDTLNRGDAVWFLISGESKAEAVERAHGDADLHDVPAVGVTGRSETVWWVDEAAASRL